MEAIQTIDIYAGMDPEESERRQLLSYTEIFGSLSKAKAMIDRMPKPEYKYWERLVEYAGSEDEARRWVKELLEMNAPETSCTLTLVDGEPFMTSVFAKTRNEIGFFHLLKQQHGHFVDRHAFHEDYNSISMHDKLLKRIFSLIDDFGLSPNQSSALVDRLSAYGMRLYNTAMNDGWMWSGMTKGRDAAALLQPLVRALAAEDKNAISEFRTKSYIADLKQHGNSLEGIIARGERAAGASSESGSVTPFKR